jgi:hypothetical protein
MSFRHLLLLALFTINLNALEPTNAKEAAEKKAAADKITADKFAHWKAALPAKQQVWETVLEQNLGTGFYLPLYQKDKLIPKRADYYTHSQELGNMWDMVMNKGGDISPVLEQISEFTKPNRKFNPFALKRKGSLEFVEDAGKAFEAYLNPILHNKYLTESIVRHRAVADILAHKTLETKNINQFIFSVHP